MTNIQSVISCIQNNQSLDNDLVVWLREKQLDSGTNFNNFFETARVSRKVIANMRQLTNFLLRFIPHQTVLDVLQGKRITLGIGQVIVEFFELLSIFYQQKNLFINANLSRIFCSITGMAALTITTIGIDSIPILAAANALRGLTNFVKMLIRRRQNEQKLITLAARLNTIREELLGCSSEEVKINFCLEYFRLKYEFERCRYLVNSSIITCSEYITMTANLLLIVGAVMLAFPGTAALGLLLITISTGARFLAGIAPIVGDLKECYPRTNVGPRPNLQISEDFHEDTSCLQQPR